MRLSPVLLIGAVPAVLAQTASTDGELEELVVTGTRAAARSVTESPVPIDVLSGFVSEDGKAMGRPVGVAIDQRGALLVADDVGNTVWRVSAR